jgi:hypothetical protein
MAEQLLRPSKKDISHVRQPHQTILYEKCRGRLG